MSDLSADAIDATVTLSDDHILIKFKPDAHRAKLRRSSGNVLLRLLTEIEVRSSVNISGVAFVHFHLRDDRSSRSGIPFEHPRSVLIESDPATLETWREFRLAALQRAKPIVAGYYDDPLFTLPRVRCLAHPNEKLLPEIAKLTFEVRATEAALKFDPGRAASFQWADVDSVTFEAAAGEKNTMGEIALFGTVGIGASKHMDRTILSVTFLDGTMAVYEIPNLSAAAVRAAFAPHWNSLGLSAEGRRSRQEAGQAAAEAGVPSARSAADPFDTLRQLAELRHAGVITQEQFEAKRSSILAAI